MPGQNASVNPEHSNSVQPKRRLPKWVLLVVSGLVIGMLGYVFYELRIMSTSNTGRGGNLSTSTATTAPVADYVSLYKDVSPTQYLREHNQDFASGYLQMLDNKVVLAQQSFVKALTTATDPMQDATIEFYNAYVGEQIPGGISDAINVLKGVAANTLGWPIMHAYALQEIVRIHNNNPGDHSITSQIFTGAPYNGFYSATSSENQNYRKLVSYAVSVYPLGILESQLALWDAQELRDQLHDATTTLEGIKKVTEIKQAVSAASAYVQSVASDPVESYDTSTIDAFNAQSLAYLATVGAADPKEAEDLFKAGIAFNAARALPPGEMTNVMYARFLLSMYGKTRISDINSALAPLSVSGTDKVSAPAKAFLLNARTDSIQHDWHISLVAIGRIDPSFMEYLVSIGWKASDFATS